MKKLSKERLLIINVTISFIISLVLIFINRFFNYHISCTLFFSIIIFICIFFFSYKLFKTGYSFFIPFSTNFLLYLYIAVYYIFIPACLLKDIIGILKFLLIIVALIAITVVALTIIVAIAAGLFEYGKDRLAIFLSCIFLISFFLITLELDRIFLLWGFKKEYMNIIKNNNPQIMVSIMNLIFQQ